MTRLTEKDESPCTCCRGIGPCRTADCSYKQIYDRLAEYEDLEEQGLLVRLPCKVGDTVYWVTESGDCVHCEHYDGIICIDEFECCMGICPKTIIEVEFELHKLGLVGKTIFLTIEEAEKALRG